MIGRRLARLGKRHGALLDVGAGEGRFTYWFSDHGFDVTPLEINPGLANSLAAATGRDVVREPFELWTPPDGSRFDVIVISQVLEHVADAGLWLGHAAELLSEDGVLFVSVPSFESLLVRTLGAAEGNINPPTHVNFFTMASLVALGADKGLAPAFQNTPNVLPAGAAMDAAAGSLRQLPRAAGHLAGLAAWAGLAATAPFGMGRFLHVYFRRAASS